MCMDSSSGQILAQQHCICGLIPSNSFHLLSCAQTTIFNDERVVDAPGCHVLFSFFLILSCSSATRIGSSCSSYAMYTPAAVRDVRQFMFLNLLPTPRILLHDQLSVLPHRPNFRQTVATNQATDHPSQELNSTFPLLLPSQAHH